MRVHFTSIDADDVTVRLEFGYIIYCGSMKTPKRLFETISWKMKARGLEVRDNGLESLILPLDEFALCHAAEEYDAPVVIMSSTSCACVSDLS